MFPKKFSIGPTNFTKWIFDKHIMFKVLFYTRYVKFYTDNVHGSVTNSMSGLARG